MNAATSRSLALAFLLLGVALPAGLVGPSAADHSSCESGRTWGTTQNITRSSPLTETMTPPELLHRTAYETDTTHDVAWEANGVDAYVYSLGCVTKERGVKFKLHDETVDPYDPDYEIAFYSKEFRQTGDRMDGHPGKGPQISGFVPDYTSYVVVVLEDGPLFAGIDTSENPPTPYSAQFRLSFRK